MTIAINSQVVLEALRLPTAPKLQGSQVAVEVLRAALATAQISQVAVETLRANGVEVPIVTQATQPMVMCCG